MIRLEPIDAKAPKGGIQGLASRRVDIFLIDPRLLRVEHGLNSRLRDFDPADPEDDVLWRSIAEVGVKQPLTAFWKDDAPYLSDGHRRLGAVLHAIANGSEIASVPVQTEGRYATEADRVLSQIVRNSGKPLMPIEQARVFKKLIDLGWDEKSIAAKVGLSRQRVVDLLTLQAAPAAVVDMVSAGEVSATLASQALRVARGDGDAAAETLKGAVARANAAGKTRATAKHVEQATEAEPGTGHPMFRAGMMRAIEVVRLHTGRKTALIAALEAEAGEP